MALYPSKWKKSNVCPVHKKDSKNVVKHYRPISLLPVFDKMFEKILHDALYDYFNSNQILKIRCLDLGRVILEQLNCLLLFIIFVKIWIIPFLQIHVVCFGYVKSI